MALIDGEHYPPVIESALDEINRRDDEIVAVVFLGGTEKVRENNAYSELGYPIVQDKNYLAAIERAVDQYKPDEVIDLSDEPVVGYRERFEIASLVLSLGLRYVGADFEFRPPTFNKISNKPSMAIIGTGKRVGKTAVSAYASRELKKNGFNPGVVAMGRGGPIEPEVIEGDKIRIDAEYLLGQARQGRHAASDHFEDALMSRVLTVGCRRCGGGLAGEPFISNVVEGAKIANGLSTDFTVFEGSGTAIPPIETDVTVVVAGVNQPAENITGYLGPFRILISDMVVLTNCEENVDRAMIDEIIQKIKRIKPGIEVVETIFRPQPLEDISGKKVFFTTTAPESANRVLKNWIESKFGAQVVGISNQLSNRTLLREDISNCKGRFDTLLTELKAAAVDVVTAIGIEQNRQVSYCDNIPLSLKAKSLSDSLVSLAKRASATV